MSDIIASAFANINPENEKFVNKNVDIVEEVCQILKEQGISQKELAKKLDKSSAEVSKWLCGTHNLTLRSITKLEVALGVDLITTVSEAKKKYQTINYVHVNKNAQRNRTTNQVTFEKSTFDTITNPVPGLNEMIA